MEDAKLKGQKIVYLSLGSMCSWAQWEVDAFFHGCKKLGCRVIWSIKTPDMIPDKNDPDFWISSWVP
jgi:UDP:flavonoid glycosyltransferase YjiC (YdhE family)